MKPCMFILMVTAALSLSACGGSGGSMTIPPPVTYTVGGTVSGLLGTGLVLQDNAGNNLSVGANGGFTFTTPIASRGAYSVTILTQPSGPAQTCVVANGTGTANANITNVQVACTTNTYTIGGVVSGLSGSGLVLQDNGGDNLPISANGSFTFATPIPSGGTYAVAVLTQPSSPAQFCAVANGSGPVNANVMSVQVNCTLTYTIGGTVSGLAGSGLVLQNNGGNSLPLSANGGFTFTAPLLSGSTYNVTVLTQPSNPPQTCAVTNGTGTANANVTTIQVSCTNNEKLLYSFGNPPDGSFPAANLVSDSVGNLYGTTVKGGAFGSGTVFELTPSNGQWTEKTIYSFCQQGQSCEDGSTPYSGLVFDAAGNLYGTTLHGGVYGDNSGGDGVVFELAPQPNGTWTETVLHSFGNGTDGVDPFAGLVFDQAGNLYGTSGYGGTGGSSCSAGCGTVFELSPGPNGQWTENVLYNFCSQALCTDGNAPLARLIFDAAGNLYGTTSSGGDSVNGDGTVFKLTPGANGQWSETVLYMFQNFQDGSDPHAGLIFDQSGNLYGTTIYGGDGNNGTAFELSPHAGSPWSEDVIYRFGDQFGSSPYAGLVSDKSGNLWGTTEISSSGGGLIFQLTPGWVEALGYPVSSFGGYAPYGSLILDTAGNLYGTASQGGTTDNGIVFEVSP